MTIALVAYPNMAAEHYQWIDSVRNKYPSLSHDEIDPHFSLIFPTGEHLNYEAFSRHIEQVTQQATAIPFTIRCAMPIPDVTSKNNHIFLVPDEGMSQIVRLHSALYTGLMAEHLRLDIPFIPHITIGYTADSKLAKEVAVHINRQNISMMGIIDMMVFLEKKDGKWSRVRDFALNG